MPCLAKGLKQQDTAISKHGDGLNDETSRVALRTLLRRYEDLFDQMHNIVRARQGAPRSERMRGLDTKGAGQMIGKTQLERSKVLANTQAKRTRNILASMAKLIVSLGGVTQDEIVEAFRPNNIDVVSSMDEPHTLTHINPVSWAAFAAKEHSNGAHSKLLEEQIASLLTLYSNQFESIWKHEEEPERKRVRIEDEEERKRHKKEVACFHAKYQANRNRVVSVALAKTLLRKGKITDRNIMESFRPSSSEQSIEEDGEGDVYVAIPVASIETVDELFGY